MKPRGFTLIEMMITLLILAVLAALALPSFRTFIGEQRMKAASFELQSALLLARSEAAKRGMAAAVTVTANDSGSPVNWGRGWVVASGSTTLASQGAFDEVAISEGGGANVVTYDGEGRSSPSASFSLSIPADANVKGRCVRIDTSGVPYSKLFAVGGC